MFIQGNIENFVTRLDVVDPKDLFETITCKWQKIVETMNTTKHTPLIKNNAHCAKTSGA